MLSEDHSITSAGTKFKITPPVIFLIHFGIMLFAFYLLHHFNVLLHYPNADNLPLWDAGILATIRDHGYIYHPENMQWNTGMFPLFPYIWRWTGLGAVGISILNYLVMLSAFWWLIKTYRFPPMLQLYLLSVPSMLFFFLPYSEAFFFLSATMIIAGVERENRWLMASGIYLAMLSRGTGLFFIPIAVLIEWMQDFSFRKEVLIRVIKKSFLPILAVVLAIATISIIQYVQTGYAFSFYEVQTTHTNKHWHGLHFPLTTWYQAENLWHDGLAALVGLGSGIILLFAGWGPLEQRKPGDPFTWNTKVVRFSLMYLTVQVWYVIFNAQIHEPSGSVVIMSMGRYIFCTPFWMIFALAIVSRPVWNSTALIFTMIIAFGIICLMGIEIYFSDNHWWAQWDRPGLLYHFGMLVLTFPLFFANRKRVGPYFLLLGYLVGVFLQLVLFDSFMDGLWVG